jgi:hypothetical protein
VGVDGRRRRALGIPLVATLLALTGLAQAAGLPWAAATYRGAGTGAWPKNTVMLKVSASGTTVPTYTFDIDSLCGKDNVGGRETYFWPVNGQGSPPLAVTAKGAFTGAQHGNFTVPRIPGVTTGPEPGSYRFSVSGSFSDAGASFSGHLTLSVRTQNGYFCSDANSPFGGTRVT